MYIIIRMKLIFLTDNKSNIIKNYLKNEYRKNNLIFDIGVFNENDNIFNLFFNFYQKFIDYNTESTFGIIIMENNYFFDMFCNKIDIFRSISSTDINVIKKSRIYYNSNIICLPNLYLKKKKLKNLIDIFINTKFNKDYQKNIDNINYFLRRIK